ncbi:MAG: Asp-tRNA(Asn)/Glu-tRNA(Gln) amidotransferase subunit GatA [Polyangiaceae bacterium]|nr:Asp-tRNA(Asn)/Glu-tRNA(Gln) amidotransferase subunit GatA [Polyangiaceae bacterium]
MSFAEILQRPVWQIADAIAKGQVSAVEVVKASLDNIERHRALGAFLTTQPERALHVAEHVDAARARGEALGTLAGVPIGLKDPICTKDVPTTAASKILTTARRSTTDPELDPERGFRPPYSATVTSKLEQAGAVVVGKCNMDEFAMGSSNENSAFFPAKNPWDPTRTPGGSSGGSAVAVAARLVPCSLGSDTGGSIRQPASLTGTVGVKPTYGRVSRYGLVAFASSLDQIGPFATDVRGAARVLKTIAGADAKDATSARVEVPDYEAACGKSIKGLKVGVPEEYFSEGIAPEVEKSIREALSTLQSLGCELRPIHLKTTRYAVATYYIVATAECSSNLARFDGVRFGFRAPGKGDLASLYSATRGAGFGAEVKRRIMLGTYVLSAGYYDAYYLHAQRVRTLFKRDFDAAFQEVDVIAAPASPTVAFKLGEKVNDPLAMYLADVYTLPASLAGIAALSVPCKPAPATVNHPELPIGLQLMGPAFSEEKLFSAAWAFEQTCPPRTPPPTTV